MGKRRSSVESSQYEADADDSELLSSPDTFRARGAVGALMFDGGGERGDNDMYEVSHDHVMWCASSRMDVHQCMLRGHSYA